MYTNGTATAPNLKASSLTRCFGSGETLTCALNNVGIELYPGQLSLLMGPSGSGKSTLLAVLSGLLHPDSGSVHVLGHDIWAMTETQREDFRLKYFGFVFQGYNLFGALTARQQLEMVLRWGMDRNTREAKERADATLALLGLSKKGDLRPIQMSGGEKQRVAIGRALIKDPQFLFADEPTSALDWAHGEQVVELLRNAAHERNATVLVVSHDSRIVPYADRVFHLEDGRMTDQEEGPPERPKLPRAHSNGAPASLKG